MKDIFINLKLFEVSRNSGGVCPENDPYGWIEKVIDRTIASGLGKADDLRLTFLLPEGLIKSANNALDKHAKTLRLNLNIGCQGVYRENIEKGGNFGAFTTLLPAQAAVNLGCTWSIIGHSEERKDKFDLIKQYDPTVATNLDQMIKANQTIHIQINKEIKCALKSGLNVLACVGETQEEKGTGDLAQQKTRIQAVLRAQLAIGLADTRELLGERELVIGYEPRWAIGPGKTPPGKDYIAFVSETINNLCHDLYRTKYRVVYGGGLKQENAPMIASVATIDGGLVALTKFSGEIGFNVDELKVIIENYIGRHIN